MESNEFNFTGYLSNQDGFHGDGIPIKNTDDVSNFLTTNVETWYELRIVDSGDLTVFHVKDRVLIFPVPDHGNKNNKWNSEFKKFVTID